MTAIWMEPRYGSCGTAPQHIFALQAQVGVPNRPTRCGAVPYAISNQMPFVLARIFAMHKLRGRYSLIVQAVTKTPKEPARFNGFEPIVRSNELHSASRRLDDCNCF